MSNRIFEKNTVAGNSHPIKKCNLERIILFDSSSVPFLDMKIVRTNEKTLIIEWFRKPS